MIALSRPSTRSFAEIWAAAEHSRALYWRLLLRRAFRAGRTPARRRLSAGVPMHRFGEIASLHSQ
jgi:hypothetical protein